LQWDHQPIFSAANVYIADRTLHFGYFSDQYFLFELYRIGDNAHGGAMPPGAAG
jgi:hypothetical protein